MKNRLTLVILIGLFLLLVPVGANALDQTDRVNAENSKVEVQNNALKIYPNNEIDIDNPWYNLSRVTVMFRDDEYSSVYSHAGDVVSFFIKSSRDNEIGWIDDNDNGDYETGEAMNPRDLGSATGFHVNRAELNRGGTVTFYIGSLKPGTPEIKVYSDDDGSPGSLLGSAYLKVEEGEGSVLLIPYEYNGRDRLKGHAGSLKDPFSLNAGDSLVLEASVKLGAFYVKDATVTFRESRGTGEYEVIGTAETDEYGKASLDYDCIEAGLHSFQATAQGWDSEEKYIQYSADRAGYIETDMPNDINLAQGEEYEFEFYITDDYGNPIDSKGEKIVEFSVPDAPDHSKYDGFDAQPGTTDYTGKTTFRFTPDRIGSYMIRCHLANKRDSYSFRVEVAYRGKTAALRAVLKKGGAEIPAAQYTDSNNDDTPEYAGRLVVTSTDSAGAEVVLIGSAVHNLVFIPENTDIVTIDHDGDIIVKDKKFSGIIPVEIADKENKVSIVYNLMISGPPVGLKADAVTNGRMAQVTLQYVDSAGNDTYFTANEQYWLELPVSGITSTNIVFFDSMGKATFTLYSEELKEYRFSVSTSKTKITKSFPVVFKLTPGPKQIIGARNLMMFIGVKGYTQDGAAKASDVAPFIKEGRTFVAVRPVADAFGATIDWNDVTQTVTLTRSDRTVTIVIGSGYVIVAKNGVSTTVTADVPAFIEDGRTVLPFRAVGEAFEAEVNFDAVTRAVSYRQ